MAGNTSASHHGKSVRSVGDMCDTCHVMSQLYSALGVMYKML